MTAFKDLQAIDSTFGSFKGATVATEEMAQAYNALTEKQQAFVMSQIGEKTKLGEMLALRASYTSAIAACSTAEAAGVLTKTGLAQADAEQVIEAIKCTFQLKQKTGALKELTKAELEQIVVDTMATNGLGRLTKEQKDAVVQFLATGKAADESGNSMLNFSNVVAQAWENIKGFAKTGLGKLSIAAGAIFLATKIYDGVTTSLTEANEALDTTQSGIEENQSQIEELNTKLDETISALDKLRSIAADDLTITDQEEIDKLESQNALLRTQIALTEAETAALEKQQEINARQAMSDANKTVLGSGDTWGRAGQLSPVLSWIYALFGNNQYSPLEYIFGTNWDRNGGMNSWDWRDQVNYWIDDLDMSGTYGIYASYKKIQTELDAANKEIAENAAAAEANGWEYIVPPDMLSNMEAMQAQLDSYTSDMVTISQQLSSAAPYDDEARLALQRIQFLIGDEDTKKSIFAALIPSDGLQEIDEVNEVLERVAAAGGVTADNMASIVGTDVAEEMIKVAGGAQEAADELNREADELRNVKQELSTAAPSERFTTVLSYIDDDISNYLEKVESLKGSLESLASGDVSSSELVSLLQEYPDLIEAAADGTDSLAAAMNQLVDDEIDGMIRSIEEVADAYDVTDDELLYFKVLLEDIGQAAKSSGNLVQSNLINQLTTLTDELEGATRAKTEYDEAMAAGEKGDLFKSYQEAYDTFKSESEAGHYGSNAFMESAKFLFGYDQLADLDFDPHKIAEWADAYSYAKEVFIDNDETESYGLGLLNALYSLADASGNITNGAGEVLASCRIEDGNYIWDVDLTRLDELGDKMGLSADAIMATIDALGVWENLDLYSTEELIDMLKSIGVLTQDMADGIRRVDLASFVKALSDAGKSDVEIGRIFNELSDMGGIEFNGTIDQIDDLLSLVVLLQDTTNASASDLVGILSNLGITLDGSTAQAQAFVDLLLALGASTDEIELLKQKLGEVGDVDVSGIDTAMESAKTNLTQTGDAADATAAKTEAIEQSAENASSEMGELADESETVVEQLDNAATAAQNATSYVQGTSNAVQRLNQKTLTSVISQFDKLTDAANRASNAISGTTSSSTSSTGKVGKTGTGSTGNTRLNQSVTATTQATGTQNAKGGTALVNDGNGPELIADGGSAYIANGGAPAIVTLSPGAKVYTAEETEDILNSRGKRTVFPAFAGGGTVGGSVPVKLVTSVTSGGGSSSSSGSSYSYSNSSSSDENPFEDLIDQFNRSMDGLQFKLDIGEIEESSYYSELKKMLDALVRETGYTIEEILDGITKSGSEIDDSLVSLVRDVYRDIYDYSKDYYESVYSDVLDKYADQLDRVSDAYETLVDAAEEYREQGYLTLETFNDLLELEPAYLGLLSDENGQLVINRESIEKIVQARKEQLAVETALAYVEQLRIAKESNDTQGLKELLKVTGETTGSTWSLVYANLALAGLSDEQYKTALKNINTIRALAGAVSGGLDEATGNVSKSIPDASDALEDILDMTEELIKAENEDMVDALKEQVEQWNKIIEAKQEALRVAKEEEDYDKKVSEYAASIAETQAKIIQLSLDDSREAQAEKAELEKQLADYQEELADYQADHAYDAAIDALDREKEAYEEEKNAEIELLEQKLSSEQKLYEAALERLDTGWESLYSQLIAYNTEYGKRINDDITSAWEAAQAAVERYGSYAAAVKGVNNPSSEDAANTGIGAGNTAQWESDAATIGAQAKAEAAAKAEAEKKNNTSSSSSNTKSYPYGKASDTSGNIGWGSRGNSVKAIQYALQQMGYNLGSTGIDGVFGQYTYNAVRSFQSATGISSDGIVGVNTRAKFKAKGYSLGGLVDYTGPAVVHGSPEKPEAFLNAEETKAVKTIAEELSAPRDGSDIIADLFMRQYGVDVSKFQAMFSMPSGHTPAEQALAAAKDALETAATTINNTRSIGDIHVTVPIQVTERLDKTEIERMSGQISSTVISTIKDGFYRKGTRPGLSLV